MTTSGEPLHTLVEHTAATREARGDDGVRIPRVLHRCLTTLDPVPERFYVACHQGWCRLNPDYDIDWWSFERCRDMLADADDPRLARAWDKLVPNTYRADLLRLFMLRERGGVYIDAPFTPSVPLSEWLPRCVSDSTHQFVTVRGWAPLTDGTPARKDRFAALLAGFMAVTPRHPLIAAALERVVQNVFDEYYGPHQTSPTGPLMLGRVVGEVLGLSGTPEDYLHVGHNEHGELSFFVLDDLCEGGADLAVRNITLPGSREVLMCSAYDLEHYRALRRVLLGGQPRYYELWRSREVYRK